MDRTGRASRALTARPAPPTVVPLATFRSMHRLAAFILALGLLGVSACSGSGSSADERADDADNAADVETTPEDSASESPDTIAAGSGSDVEFCAAIAAMRRKYCRPGANSAVRLSFEAPRALGLRGRRPASPIRKAI